MNYYFNCFRRYAKFSARASRKEYWMFTLIDTLILTALILVLANTPKYVGFYETNSTFLIIAWAMIIYFIATILPRLAVTVRRLHDTGRSGWNIILPAGVGLVGNLLTMATKTEEVAIVFGIAQIAASIYLVVLLCLKGEPEENYWGENPYAEPTEE